MAQRILAGTVDLVCGRAAALPAITDPLPKSSHLQAVRTAGSPVCKARAKRLRSDGEGEDIHATVVGAEDVSRAWRHKGDAHLLPIREETDGFFKEVGLPCGNECSDMKPILVVRPNGSRHDSDGVSELPSCQLMPRLSTQSGFGFVRAENVQGLVGAEQRRRHGQVPLLNLSVFVF